MRVSVCAAAVMLVGAVGAPPAYASTTDAAKCLVASHRGLTNAPQTRATEDGMVAMRRAVSVGTDILEADARATADDRVMLMHDSTVDRTTNGHGSIRSMTAEQVLALRL